MKRLLPLVLLLTIGLMAGCDGGGPDLDEAPVPTVAFGTAEVSALEVDNPTVELPVVLNTPVDSPLRVEILFAKAASGENFTLSDIGITNPDESRAFYNDEGELTAYVVGAVTFPAGADAGATQTVSVSIADTTVEGQEIGLFALQTATTEGGEVEIGAPSEFALTIQAEGTETLVAEDFADAEGDLGVLSAYSVACNADWYLDSFDGDQFAEVNGYQQGPCNDWLISPPLDFTSVADETLTFSTAKNFSGGTFQVLVSTSYDGEGNPEEAEWTDITDQFTFSGGGYEDTPSGEGDLSSFEGEAVYVAFKYATEDAAALWQVDDIRVTGRTLVE